MNSETGSVLERLNSKMVNVLDEAVRNKNAIIEHPSGLPDANDRASVQEIVRARRLALDRLNKISEAIEYLTKLLKNGWDMKCTRCEENELSADRVVEHLTSLCVECKSELEAKNRKGSEFFYQ